MESDTEVDKTIFYARIAAIVILVVFAILMMNLYRKLRILQSQQPVQVTRPAR